MKSKFIDIKWKRSKYNSKTEKNGHLQFTCNTCWLLILSTLGADFQMYDWNDHQLQEPLKPRM